MIAPLNRIAQISEVAAEDHGAMTVARHAEQLLLQHPGKTALNQRSAGVAGSASERVCSRYIACMVARTASA